MNKHQKLVQTKFLNDEEAVIKRLKSVYGQSLKDITGKIKGLDSSISAIQAALKTVTDTDIGDLALAFLGKQAQHMTPAEAKETLQSMIQSKVYQKKYQQALKKQVGIVYDKMKLEQYTTISEYLTYCYDNGYIGTMFDLQGQGIPLAIPLDQEAMVRAVQLDSKISKPLYQFLGEDVDLLKDKIAAQVSRGISSGMTFQQVAQQLAAQTNIGYNRAVRIARTEGHRIQCQAGMDACHDAKAKGADVLKQWDSTMDKRTRESHALVDGEVRELDEDFSNGLRFPGDPDGGAGEVINCRCALLQRARWALDDEELEALKQKAQAFGLDKSATFDDFKAKYIDAVKAPPPPPKKEYLTKKKLEQKIKDIDDQLKTATDPAVIQALEDQKADFQAKLDEKIVAAETKKLKKEQILLQDQLSTFDDTEKFDGIWYGQDDITIKDWKDKKDSIPKKIDYYENQIKNVPHTQDEIDKLTALLDKTKDFDSKGKAYWDIQDKLDDNAKALTKLQKNGKITQIDDAFSQDRKDAAYWFTDSSSSSPNPGKGEGVPGADKVLRDKAGEVWRGASTAEKDSIYDYTGSYHKYNEPLRGIEYWTNKYFGPGNVNLDEIGVKQGLFKRGEVRKNIDAITSIIDKSAYDFDIWVQRGCRRDGMDKFFGIDISDFNLPESKLAAKLVGTTPTEYAFMSTGVAKGRGLNTSGGILLNIYAPRGTKAMYLEPISQFGRGDGRSWDGISKQWDFGTEAELLFQRGTKFRVTKVEKSGGTIYIDMEVIEQGVQ